MCRRFTVACALLALASVVVSNWGRRVLPIAVTEDNYAPRGGGHACAGAGVFCPQAALCWRTPPPRPRLISFPISPCLIPDLQAAIDFPLKDYGFPTDLMGAKVPAGLGLPAVSGCPPAAAACCPPPAAAISDHHPQGHAVLRNWLLHTILARETERRQGRVPSPLVVSSPLTATAPIPLRRRPPRSRCL